MRIWWRKFLNDTPSCFSRVESAFTATLALLILAVGLYIGIHWVQPSDCPDWSKAVTLSDDLLFKPQFCQMVLERYISPADMTEFKKGISDRCEEMARVAIRERQLTLGQIAMLAQEGLADQPLPFILQKTSDQKTETDYRLTSLTNLSHWLQTNQSRFAPDRQGQVDASREALRRLSEREAGWKNELERQFACLKPVLAFEWLYIDHSKWIIELIAWCSFGVLANTIIKLIGAMREDKYQAREFCLLFPKAILAPVLALVITALWASGLSDSKIRFTNLPYLLVIFFLLGFATEQLYEKIIGLSEIIVTPMAKVSQARLEAAARESRYKYTTPLVRKEDRPPPRTVPELAAKLRDVAKSAFERGVITRVAAKSNK